MRRAQTHLLSLEPGRRCSLFNIRCIQPAAPQLSWVHVAQELDEAQAYLVVWRQRAGSPGEAQPTLAALLQAYYTERSCLLGCLELLLDPAQGAHSLNRVEALVQTLKL